MVTPAQIMTTPFSFPFCFWKTRAKYSQNSEQKGLILCRTLGKVLRGLTQTHVCLVPCLCQTPCLVPYGTSHVIYLISQEYEASIVVSSFFRRGNWGSETLSNLSTHSNKWSRWDLNPGTIIPEPVHLAIILAIYCHIANYPNNLVWSNKGHLLTRTVSISKEFRSRLPWVLRDFHSGSGSLVRLPEGWIEAGGFSSQMTPARASAPHHVDLSRRLCEYPHNIAAGFLLSEWMFEERARWKLQFLYLNDLASEVAHHHFQNILLVTQVALPDVEVDRAKVRAPEREARWGCLGGWLLPCALYT